MQKVGRKALDRKQPSVGVALLGIGLRSIALVPLLDFLDQEQIEVDLWIAASSAARICAQKGLGFSSEQMIETQKELTRLKPFSKIDYQTILSLGNSRFGRYDQSSGAFKNKHLLGFYKDLFGEAGVEDLNPTTILQATDLKTELAVSLTEGPLADAVYASSAFFPFLPPIEWNGQLLVDGSFVMPLPVMEAVKRDIDIIIAAIAIEDYPVRPQKVTQGFLHSSNLMLLSMVKAQMAMAINLHHCEIIPVFVKCKKMVAWKNGAQLEEVLDWGHETIARQGADIKAVIQEYKGQSE